MLVGPDYPLIDDTEIDITEELLACANLVVIEFGGEDCQANPAEIDPAVEFFENRLIQSESALPVRFVILNFLYRLARFRLASESSAQQMHLAVWPHLERFVRLQETVTISDPKAIRWEISNACVIHDWDRATMLLDHLKSKDMIRASESRALKGQMQICSVVATRDNEQKDSPGWWTPTLDCSYFSSEAPLMRPFGLLCWGLNLADAEEHSLSEREALSDGAHEWDSCFDENSELLGSYHAAWGKCHFLKKDYLKAAKCFEHLAAHGDGLGVDDLRPIFYRNAAKCFTKAGGIQAAIRWLEECAEKFPRAKGLWLELAKLHLSEPMNVDLQMVLECLRKEEEIDPTFGEDARTSVALMLGELSGTDPKTALETVLQSNPKEVEFINGLLFRHWHAFQFLDEKSGKDWCAAALYLWGAEPGPRLRRQIAGTFAQIAEDQIRKLLERFRTDKGSDVLARASSESKKQKFLKYLGGQANLTLGEMLREIGRAQEKRPDYPALKVWLQDHANLLMRGWDSKRAWRLNELRKPTAHAGEISDEQIRELYELSVWIVTQLAESR